MGACFLDGIQYGDDGRDAGPDYASHVERPKVVVPEPDWDRLAEQVVFPAVYARANRFRADPLYFLKQLDVIRVQLSTKPWPKVVEYLTGRIASEEERRWQGYGGETARINMTAARIVAREMIDAELHDDALDAKAAQALIAAE